MTRNRNDTSYTIILERKYGQDKVKAVDLLTRVISKKIIMNIPYRHLTKTNLPKKTHSDIER